MTGHAAPPLRLVAIIAAYNEEDIIGQAVAHLTGQGASVYLLDDASTDRTVAIARQFAGKGLIAVEPLPRVSAEDGSVRFCWSEILNRKAQLAQELDADWFIHQDADEFRESPWPHLSLVEAVGLVDRLGWNAIDFEVFNFVPGDIDYRPGDDPRVTFRRYCPAAEYDLLQVRCWRKTDERVDLAATGGHEALFPNRRVFPIKFPMRHFPIRSAEHGERKVFRERKPRFDPEERARGWHLQYDQLAENGLVVPDSSSALLYDRDAANVALQIRNRIVEAACPSVASHSADGLAGQVKQLEDDIERQSAHATAGRLAIEECRRDLETVRAALLEAQDDAARHAARAMDLTLALEQCQRDVEAARTALVGARADVARHVAHANDLAEVLVQGERDLHALRAARDEVETRLAETGHVVDALSVTVRDLRQEVDRVNRGASDLASQLSDLHASRSWRVTAPLRAAWRWLGGK
jgi:hypothetical protein